MHPRPVAWDYREHRSALLTTRRRGGGAERMNMINRVRLLMLMILSLGVACTSPNDVAAQTLSPQYLLFQIFLGAPHDGAFHRGLSKNGILEIAHRILGKLNPGATDSDRILGVAIGAIAMDQGADDTRAAISEAFEAALETDLAIALHLDDYMFWGQARTPEGRLLRDLPGTTEWKDWSGTPVDSLD